MLTQEIVNEAAQQRPSVGERVRVETGKRRGAEGTVLRHIVDRFGGKWKYGSDAQQSLREVSGRYGYRVQVQTETHGTFWMDAEKVTVIG